jgi:hypothetical protein
MTDKARNLYFSIEENQSALDFLHLFVSKVSELESDGTWNNTKRIDGFLANEKETLIKTGAYHEKDFEGLDSIQILDILKSVYLDSYSLVKKLIEFLPALESEIVLAEIWEDLNDQWKNSLDTVDEDDYNAQEILDQQLSDGASFQTILNKMLKKLDALTKARIFKSIVDDTKFKGDTIQQYATLVGAEPTLGYIMVNINPQTATKILTEIREELKTFKENRLVPSFAEFSRILESKK